MEVVFEQGNAIVVVVVVDLVVLGADDVRVVVVFMAEVADAVVLKSSNEYVTAVVEVNCVVASVVDTEILDEAGVVEVVVVEDGNAVVNSVGTVVSSVSVVVNGM